MDYVPFPKPLPGSVVAPPAADLAPVPLTDAQRAFAREYVKDFKIARAAERLGMSSAWGQACFADGRVQTCIIEAKRRYQENVDASVTSTLENVTVITRVNGSDYWKERTVYPEPLVDQITGQVFEREPYVVRELKPFAEWTDDMHKALKSIKQTKYGVEIELWDKLAANVHIGRFFNMWTDKIAHTGPDGGPLTLINGAMTPEQAAEAWADTLNADR